MMWGYGFGPMGAWMWLWGVLWLVVVGLGIWAMVRWASRRTPATGGSPSAGPSALEILRQRYARGEIDEATFARMRQQLEASPARNELTGLPQG